MNHHQSGEQGRKSWTVHVKDGNLTEISQLMEELLAEARKHVQDKSLILSRLVLCEELLIEYAENGYGEMEVRLRRFFRHRFIRIRIPGKKWKRSDSPRSGSMRTERMKSGSPSTPRS